MRRVGLLLLPALVLCHALVAVPARAADERAAPRIYKWVDANGIAHYTTDPERIPKALRNRIETLERRTPEPAAALADEVAPAAVVTVPAPAVDPEPIVAPEPVVAPEPIVAPEPALAGTSEIPAAPEPAAQPPGGAAPATTGARVPATIGARVPATIGARVPAPAAAPAAAPAGESWATRDAAPRLRGGAALLASGNASPEELAALDAERQALDARIAEVEAEIARDETMLKDLISDPELDAEVPLFDQPEFLEISRRLPELQVRLQELRDERAKLEIQ